MLRQAGEIHPVQPDGSLVSRDGPGDEVQGGGFSGAVAPDDGDEIPILQGEV